MKKEIKKLILFYKSKHALLQDSKPENVYQLGYNISGSLYLKMVIEDLENVLKESKTKLTTSEIKKSIKI